MTFSAIRAHARIKCRNTTSSYTSSLSFVRSLSQNAVDRSHRYTIIQRV